LASFKAFNAPIAISSFPQQIARGKFPCSIHSFILL